MLAGNVNVGHKSLLAGWVASYIRYTEASYI